VTRPNGRRLIDISLTVDAMDEHGVRVAMGYLIGASVHSVAVRRALNGALDAAATDAKLRADQAVGE
jgi:hypothetical protein